MDAGESGVAAAPVTLEAGVDFGGLAGSMESGDGDLRPRDLFEPGGGVTGLGSPGHGSTGHTGGDLHPQDLFGPAGGGPDHAGVRGPGSPHRLTHPLLGAERVGGVDPVPAAFAPADREHPPTRRRWDPLGVVGLHDNDLTADFVRAGGDRGGTMRPLALAAMMLGAMTLVGEPDAPWPNQFGALLVWLAACIALFLSWH